MDKLPYDQLIDMLAAARAKVPPGTKWQHYKGGEFIVEKAVFIDETNEAAVLYNSPAQPDIAFVRPLASWLEVVEWNGETLPRFTKVY